MRRQGRNPIKQQISWSRKIRERIPMHEPFTMEGEVELYLNRLTDAMQITLRHQMLKGIEDGVNWETSEELPRPQVVLQVPPRKSF